MRKPDFLIKAGFTFHNTKKQKKHIRRSQQSSFLKYFFISQNYASGKENNI